jgi:hypothetical protein
MAEREYVKPIVLGDQGEQSGFEHEVHGALWPEHAVDGLQFGTGLDPLEHEGPVGECLEGNDGRLDRSRDQKREGDEAAERGPFHGGDR